jgi:hypothetical protein
MPHVKSAASKENILGGEKWEPTPSQAASKQAILQVAAEGGSITLYGMRGAGWWRYRIETSESALDVDDEMPVVPKRPWVQSWHSALAQLDRYPWTQLHPWMIHPEFLGPIFEALQARKAEGRVINWDLWDDFLKPE